MNQGFKTNAAELAKFHEVMDRIRERNAARMAEVVIATAQGKVHLYGWPVLTGDRK